MRTLLATIMVVAAPLAGCLDGDDEPTAVTLSWMERPTDATVGDEIEITWALAGDEREIQHTGLHYGPDSVSDPSSPADYPESAGVVQPAQVPGTYSAMVTLEQEGSLSFRAHAIVDGENLWADEVTITVSAEPMTGPGASIEITSVPANATVGEPFEVEYRVHDAPPAFEHTGVHYGASSVSDPAADGYDDETVAGEPATGATFTVEITPEANGTLYGRAHATVVTDDVWSDEFQVIVEASPEGPVEPVNHTVEMLDLPGGLFRFDSNNITVSPGDSITWVNNGNVVHTATSADDLFDSGDVDAGENFTWEVPADLEPGTYEYYCIYHGDPDSPTTDLNMVATFVVESPG